MRNSRSSVTGASLRTAGRSGSNCRVRGFMNGPFVRGNAGRDGGEAWNYMATGQGEGHAARGVGWGKSKDYSGAGFSFSEGWSINPSSAAEPRCAPDGGAPMEILNEAVWTDLKAKR